MWLNPNGSWTQSEVSGDVARAKESAWPGRQDNWVLVLEVMGRLTQGLKGAFPYPGLLLNCFLHPEAHSHLPPHSIPLGHPSAPALSICLMHPTWTGDLFHT